MYYTVSIKWVLQLVQYNKVMMHKIILFNHWDFRDCFQKYNNILVLIGLMCYKKKSLLNTCIFVCLFVYLFSSSFIFLLLLLFSFFFLMYVFYIYVFILHLYIYFTFIYLMIHFKF